MKYLSLFLCFKYLCSKKIVLLSITAVAISCALLVVVTSLFTGFIEAIEKSASRQMGDIVITAPVGRKIPQYDQLISDLDNNPGIEASTAVLTSQGLLLLGKGNVRAVQVWGIEMPKRAVVTPFAESLVRQKKVEAPGFGLGDIAAKDGGFVSIGVVADADDETDEYDLAEVKEFVGQKVLLTTGRVAASHDIKGIDAATENDTNKTSGKFERKKVKFTITDIVFSGMYEMDKGFVYLPIGTLSEKLYPDLGKVADTIHIRLAPGLDADTGCAIVRGIWGNFADGKILWATLAKIRTSRQELEPILTEYRKQMAILIIIFGVVSGGVVLLISCIFYLITATKQKDIAVANSCGLGSGAITMLFVNFGMIIGVIGSVVGVGLGYLVTVNVNEIEGAVSMVFGLKLWKSSTYMFNEIPHQVHWESVGWIVIIAILAAALGALIPAITAARTEPVKILRYE